MSVSEPTRGKWSWWNPFQVFLQIYRLYLLFISDSIFSSSNTRRCGRGLGYGFLPPPNHHSTTPASVSTLLSESYLIPSLFYSKSQNILRSPITLLQYSPSTTFTTFYFLHSLLLPTSYFHLVLVLRKRPLLHYLWIHQAFVYPPFNAILSRFLHLFNMYTTLSNECDSVYVLSMGCTTLGCEGLPPPPPKKFCFQEPRNKKEEQDMIYINEYLLAIVHGFHHMIYYSWHKKNIHGKAERWDIEDGVWKIAMEDWSMEYERRRWRMVDESKD